MFSRTRQLMFIALCCLVMLAGPAVRAEAEDLFLYCGAGLRQPVDELIKTFQEKTGQKVQIEFGGSGQLLARFKATGKGDVFLPGVPFLH